MPRILLSCGLVLALALPAVAEENKDYTSKAGKFSAAFPGKPKEQEVTAAGATGQSVTLEAKGGAYTVTYVDLPDAAADALKTPEAIELVLGATRDAAVTQMKGKVIDDDKIKLDGNVGRDFKVELPEKKMMRNRMFIVGKRLYQVMVVGSKEFVEADASEKFLKTFKLTK
jgi:hypothetical protein